MNKLLITTVLLISCAEYGGPNGEALPDATSPDAQEITDASYAADAQVYIPDASLPDASLPDAAPEPDAYVPEPDADVDASVDEGECE